MRGVKTNINFLKNVLSNPAFIKGAITTRFIDENPNLLRTTIQQNRAQKVWRRPIRPGEKGGKLG